MDSTLRGLQPQSAEHAGVWARRVFLTLLLVLVLAGLSGLLGVRSAEQTATGSGYTLTVEYPSTARAGLDVPLQVTVERPSGLDPRLTLAISGEYLDAFETQAFHPEPAESRRDEELLYLTFDTAEGETFTVDYDAYVQPDRQQGLSATVTLLDRNRLPLASVDITTVLLP